MVEQLEALRLPACGIKRTAEGLDMAEVERLFQTEGIKFLHDAPIS